MRTHEKFVHDRFRYYCDFCDKSYGQKKLLEGHVRSVHEGKYIKCGKCGKPFVHRDYLMKHIERHELKEAGLKFHNGKIFEDSLVFEEDCSDLIETDQKLDQLQKVSNQTESIHSKSNTLKHYKKPRKGMWLVILEKINVKEFT